jgi:hypothetical protein
VEVVKIVKRLGNFITTVNTPLLPKIMVSIANDYFRTAPVTANSRCEFASEMFLRISEVILGEATYQAIVETFRLRLFWPGGTPGVPPAG